MCAKFRSCQNFMPSFGDVLVMVDSSIIKMPCTSTDIDLGYNIFERTIGNVSGLLVRNYDQAVLVLIYCYRTFDETTWSLLVYK